MSNNNGGGSLDVLLAFLLGGAVGGVLGVLYAPSSGEETRRRIKFYAEEAADKAVEKMQAAREETISAIEKVKSEFNEQKSKVVTAIDAGKRAFRDEKNALEQNV